MINKFFSGLGKIAHGCSGFGHYFAYVQSGNCHDCPDCRCEDGPTLREAQEDYREMLRFRNSHYIG